MSWTIQTDREFDKDLRKLDRPVAMRVLKALTALEEMDDPTTRCKPLTGPLVGLWRLRVGDYRVILDIQHDRLVIVALEAGHRSNVYG